MATGEQFAAVRSNPLSFRYLLKFLAYNLLDVNEAVMPIPLFCGVDCAPDPVLAVLIVNFFRLKDQIFAQIRHVQNKDDGLVWREEKGLCATKKTIVMQF